MVFFIILLFNIIDFEFRFRWVFRVYLVYLIDDYFWDI